MKKIIMIGALMLLICPAVPSHAFLDYLFSGSSSRDAIDNSAVGDLRSWWTGNPAYVFNPYYSGATNQNNASQGQPAPQQQEATVNYVPAQGAYGQQPPQGYPQQQYQAAPQQYQQPQQYAQPQQYQQAPQQQYPAQQYAPQPQQAQAQPYGAQQVPQQYQNAPQGYQSAPQ
jgi:hypothetical protein